MGEKMKNNYDKKIVNIIKAELEDLSKILEIQKKAFLYEAISESDYLIEPMVQTIEDLEEEFKNSLFLKAQTTKGEIVGSVRGDRIGGKTKIRKLSVSPDHQRQGVGQLLIAGLEAALPASIYQLFTSSKNFRALGCYDKLGYKKYKEEDFNQTLRFFHLEKRI
jgi:ribosomal protein S18 acetylase RimI-like enzyme